MSIKAYNVPVQSIDKLLCRLETVYKRHKYDPSIKIETIMFIEGQQDVINFIRRWIQDECTSTETISTSSRSTVV